MITVAAGGLEGVVTYLIWNTVLPSMGTMSREQSPAQGAAGRAATLCHARASRRVHEYTRTVRRNFAAAQNSRSITQKHAVLTTNQVLSGTSAGAAASSGARVSLTTRRGRRAGPRAAERLAALAVRGRPNSD